MALSWWPVALLGLVGLAVVVALVVLVPMEPPRRALDPLANTARLTRLPEYARLARTRALAMVVTIALLVLLFATALLASARPVETSWADGQSEPPADVMLCVAAPLTDPATGELLAHFARQASDAGAGRIGLTSPNRRVIPLTGDDQYAAGRLGDFAEANAPDNAFAPPVTYLDYAPSIEDQLALCLTGFPQFEDQTARSRSVIYLGPGVIRPPDEERPALFTDQQVGDLIDDAGVQINAITLGAGPEQPLRTIVEDSGGQYFSLRPDVPAAGSVTDYLDSIAAQPAPPALPGGADGTGATPDSPGAPLVAGTLIATLLALALVVVRR